VARFTAARRLVGLYLATAHLSLAVAFLATAWDPLAVAGFFYHARIVGIVHLVTIGWIAMSILGMAYVVLPIACGVGVPVRRGDYLAYALTAIGLIGMVAHFWIGEFGGMAWSAVTAALGMLHVVMRVGLAMRRAKVASGVKLHLYFAAANVTGAVTMGVLLAFDKVHAFLPGYVLSNVFAHAHLAASGWVLMTVMGLGYRLLPMVLPAAMPSGHSLSASALLLEMGTVGLFASLTMQSGATFVFALLIVSAFLTFGGHVLWMLANPRRPPRHRTQPDFAVQHLAASGACFLLACVCGVTLTAISPSEATMRVALLYGVLGLVGGLAQAIVGFERRLLPMAAACWDLQDGGMTSPAPRRPALAVPTFFAWLAGVPLVAVGFFVNEASVLGWGAWILFGGCLLMSIDLFRFLSPAQTRKWLREPFSRDRRKKGSRSHFRT